MRYLLCEFLFGEKVLDREPLIAFDVGCSGGLPTEWDVFGPALRAIGFDPLVAEIERLRRAERRPNVTYEDAFVGLAPVQEREQQAYEYQLSARGKFFPDLQARSSARRALDLLALDLQKDIFNSGSNVVLTTRHIALDDFARQRSLAADLLKIDTDGHDVEVLLGAQDLLRSSVLAAKVECFFQQPASRYSNSFANVDQQMTANGFYLCDMGIRTYSRSALPGPFLYDSPMQTATGSPVWADVTYLRDLAHPDYENIFDFLATPERIIKMACLMEIFGMADAAAELLVNRADRLPYPVDRLLDVLVPNDLGRGLSYRQYIEQFSVDPRRLFPSRIGRCTLERLPFVAHSRYQLSLTDIISYPHWNASTTSSTAGLLITTSPEQWAYSAYLPLPDNCRSGILIVEAETIAGQVGLAIVNADQTEITAETILSPGRASIAILPVSNCERGALMIRNGPNERASCLKISRVEFYADA